MISTLVWMKWPTDFGYAITALERLFFEVATELAEGDSSKVHFAYPDLTPGPPASLPAGFSNVACLDVRDVSPTGIGALERVLRTARPDLVLTFDVQPVHPAFRVMRRHGVSTIISYWGAPISAVMPTWKLLVKKALLRVSHSRCDSLIFESQAMADLALYGRGVPRHMIDLVPLGVDTEVFRPAPCDYVHAQFGIPRDRKVIVFSGHCTPRKGIKTLIEAAIELLAVRKRQDVCFLICGNRGDESLPYEAMYAGLGIESWIRFAGFRSDMLPIFQSGYCGVIPSSGWDSFTLSSVEMAATGLPVVASRLQGLAEAVIHEETGLLVEPGDAAALANALETMLNEPARARSYGAQGRRRAERDLSLTRQRERLTTALQRRLPRTAAVRPKPASAVA